MLMRALVWTGAALCAAFAVTTDDAEARQRGLLLAKLMSRGIEQPLAPSYASGTLRLEQLADCLMTAKILDDRGEELEALPDTVAVRLADVEASSAELERNRRSLNSASQSALDALNAAISDHETMVRHVERIQTYVKGRRAGHDADLERYEAACAKPYYADNLEEARQRAGLWRPGARLPR